MLLVEMKIIIFVVVFVSSVCFANEWDKTHYSQSESQFRECASNSLNSPTSMYSSYNPPGSKGQCQCYRNFLDTLALYPGLDHKRYLQMGTCLKSGCSDYQCAFTCQPCAGKYQKCMGTATRCQCMGAYLQCIRNQCGEPADRNSNPVDCASYGCANFDCGSILEYSNFYWFQNAYRSSTFFFIINKISFIVILVTSVLWGITLFQQIRKQMILPLFLCFVELCTVSMAVFYLLVSVGGRPKIPVFIFYGIYSITFHCIPICIAIGWSNYQKRLILKDTVPVCVTAAFVFVCVFVVFNNLSSPVFTLLYFIVPLVAISIFSWFQIHKQIQYLDRRIQQEKRVNPIPNHSIPASSSSSSSSSSSYSTSYIPLVELDSNKNIENNENTHEDEEQKKLVKVRNMLVTYNHFVGIYVFVALASAIFMEFIGDVELFRSSIYLFGVWFVLGKSNMNFMQQKRGIK